MHACGRNIDFVFFIFHSSFCISRRFDDQSRNFFQIILCHFIYHFLWVTFTPEFVPRDQVFPKVASHADVAGRRENPQERRRWRIPKLSFTVYYFCTKLCSFSCRRFIHNNCSGHFLSPYFLFYKFSPWISWRLPFVVNAALTHANIYSGKLDEKSFWTVYFFIY